MRVLMLGWEFPPYISGGLGAACFGLTRALNRRDIHITFVLPRPIRNGHSDQLSIIGAAPSRPAFGLAAGRSASTSMQADGLSMSATADGARTTTLSVPATFHSPYPSASTGVAATGAHGPSRPEAIAFLDEQPDDTYAMPDGPEAAARQYALMCVARLRGQSFDLIHAHDWPTFPAAIALSALMRVPYVAHVHSTVFDRSGEQPDPQIYEIERRGMHEAGRVITVSAFTKAVCIERFGVQAHQIEVVYNGADGRPGRPQPILATLTGDAVVSDPGRQKIVLFLGRITMQKGPEHFVAAAKRVLGVMDNVRFVMAGAGDMDKMVIEAAAAAGIGHCFSFTGFLRGDDVDRVFDLADVYVMPSVSEPFGIAPLEAINRDVPVIISRQSGVSEVLRHALKVDFWNTVDLADKIIAVLRHPPLSQSLRSNARVEVQGLTWDAAAERCLTVYDHTLKASGVS